MKSVLSWINRNNWKTRKKKCLMVDNYILDIVLDKIKMIAGIGKFDIETGDKLPGNFTLKNVGILITCVIKDNDKSTNYFRRGISSINE